MLCEICCEREATNHTTKVAGDVTTTSNLCTECFKTVEPSLAQKLSSAFQAGCHYCGGQPDCTAPDLSAGPSDKQALVALCKRCALEFYAFFNRKLPRLGTAKMTPAELARVPTMLAELDQHMRDWVSQRGPDDAA
jgi:protein-arginine kinase activator protein McsA